MKADEEAFRRIAEILRGNSPEAQRIESAAAHATTHAEWHAKKDKARDGIEQVPPTYPDVAPYLTRADGITPVFFADEHQVRETGNTRPAVDAVVDPWGKALCTVCLTEIFSMPNMMGMAFEDKPKFDGLSPRVWWFERRIEAFERAAMYAYLADPKCSIERHLPYEKASFDQAVRVFEGAKATFARATDRRPGWSIEAGWKPWRDR